MKKIIFIIVLTIIGGLKTSLALAQENPSTIIELKPAPLPPIIEVLPSSKPAPIASPSPSTSPSPEATRPPILEAEETYDCDVIIAGGSTASLAAALSSAREGQKTCFLEATDWPGGQLTSSGASAIDFASFKSPGVNLNYLTHRPQNIPTDLWQWFLKMGGNPGACWVSTKCYEPQKLLQDSINPTIERLKLTGNLHIFLNTVVKSVLVDYASTPETIKSLIAIQRSPIHTNGYERHFSEAIPDWYSPEDSEYFSKKILKFGHSKKTPVFIDATEFGDILVLSNASYLQGIEESEGLAVNSRPKCGQAAVFPLVMEYGLEPNEETTPKYEVEHPEFYNIKAFERRFSWWEVWSYRRIRTNIPSTGIGRSKLPHKGDLSLQNWNPGNDYPFAYFLKSPAEIATELKDWKGGLNLQAIASAEKHAIGWYHYLKQIAPQNIRPFISLNKSAFGTQTGLAKLPYLRDTRRSVGLGSFLLTYDHLKGINGITGKKFTDKVGIGVYLADIHPLKCPYPLHVRSNTKTAPYYIPFRALTNRDYGNLLVAGKTMAQSFLANASTRVQLIEWSSGIAAGSAAAYMSENRVDSREALKNITDIQARVAKYSPIDWTF